MKLNDYYYTIQDEIDIMKGNFINKKPRWLSSFAALDCRRVKFGSY